MTTVRRVYIAPSFRPNTIGGVALHYAALARHLPEFGWEVAERDDGRCLTHIHAAHPGVGCDVYTNHGIHPARQDAPGWMLEQNAIIRDNLRTARQVVTGTRWTVAQWGEIGRRRPVHIIPNGADLDAAAATPRGVWRAKLRAAGPLVLWGKHSIDDVVDPGPAITLALLRPEVQVVIPIAPERLATAPANVRCVGPQPYAAMQQLIADCDVYLAVTRENCPLQLLEALALGRPVLGYDWAGSGEIMAGAPEAGVMVRPGAEAELAAALPALLDPERVARMGEAGRQLIADRYQWRHVVGRVAAEAYEPAWAEREAERTGPVCSIVIPVYNKAEYVGETVRSALAQVGAPAYEVVVVDDGSTDGSRAAVEAAIANRPAARLIVQANAGVAAARNAGIAAARGRYICCLDADDTIEPEFLARTSAALEADWGAGVAYTDMRIFGHGPHRGERIDHVLRGQEYDLEELKRKNFIPCCNLFRRRAWEQAGGYDGATIEGSSWEDYSLWLGMGKLGWYGRRVPAALFNYRKLHKAGRDYEAQAKAHRVRGLVNRQHRDLFPPLVSVVIPCYRQARFLADAIGSVLAQTFPDHEVVVVDDGNAPAEARRIAQIVAGYDREAVRLVRLESNHGLATARNAGFHAARGTWVVPLDADDLLEPSFLEATLAATGLDPQRFAYTDSVLWWSRTDKREPLPADEYNFRELLTRLTWPCAILVAKQAWLGAGGYKPEMSAAGGWEDWEFAITLGENGVCGVRVPEPLFIYRQHAKSQMRHQAEARRDVLREKLRRLHPASFRGEFAMGCCGNRQPARPAAKAQDGRAGRDAGKPGEALVRYVGAQSGAATWRGPSGRAYRFGALVPLQWCAAEDAAHFARQPEFVIERAEGA